MSNIQGYELWVNDQFSTLHTHIDNSRVFLAIKTARTLVAELKKWAKKDATARVAIVTSEPEAKASEATSDSDVQQAVETESKTVDGEGEGNTPTSSASAACSVELVDSTPENQPSVEVKDKLAHQAQVWLDTWADDPKRATLMLERRLSLRLLREFEITPSDEDTDGLLEGDAREAEEAKERASDPYREIPNRGWELSEGDSTSVTHNRKEEGSDLHSFRVVGVVNCSIHDLFPIIYEASLYNLWFPLMKTSEETAMVSRFHKIVRTTVSCPWPVDNRLFDLEARGVDNTEEGRVLINIASITSSPHVTIPPVPSGHVLADMHQAGYMLEILSPKQTRLSFYANVDIKMGFLPNWLLNIATKNLVQMIVRSMESAAKSVNDPSKPWVAKMNQHAQVYGELRQILDGYLDKLPKE